MIRMFIHFLYGIKRTDSQFTMVLKHLKCKGSITSMEAIKLYSITRLSGRIYELRNSGYDITSVPVESINIFGKKTEFVKYVLNRKIS